MYQVYQSIVVTDEESMYAGQAGVIVALQQEPGGPVGVLFDLDESRTVQEVPAGSFKTL